MADNLVASLRSSAEWIKEMEYESWLGTAELQIEAADAIQQRDDEIVRLRAAGDALATIVGDVVVPYDDESKARTMVTAYDTWREARRG